jgi:hypothetical protein
MRKDEIESGQIFRLNGKVYTVRYRVGDNFRCTDDDGNEVTVHYTKIKRL